MLALVKAFDWKNVDAGFAENPELLGFRDERGRNWLHLCCGVNAKRSTPRAEASIRTAELLLKLGIDIDQPAFVEGQWRATPLWYAIARGENLPLARYLLEHGSSPNHCLFAASWNNDLDTIRLLVKHGADLNEVAEDETPFLGAVKFSRFGPAEELLKLGADINHRDPKGMTALHYMLKKNSDKKHFAMLLKYGPRGDIPNRDGLTAAQLMRNKRDPEFRSMAERLRNGAQS
ncbi:MAG TPA: ankyrin repeat domain-containing protein [Candidatus Binataceae bacterium]|nr:ankyrin repeat domain-containing protein [Candidatus Binataceae bacterium]